MARPVEPSTQTNSSQIQSISALNNNGAISIEHIDLRDADFKKDGHDLIVESDNGDIVVIEGYFANFEPPTLLTSEGQVFDSSLVESFLLPDNPGQYAGPSTQDDPIGAIQELSGEATITRLDGTVEQVDIGTVVFQGDIIETDASGALNILFVDESSFAVSEDARLAIDEYVFDPETQGGMQNFSVLKGMFVYTSGLIGRDDPDDVGINTPVGSIGIRGTIIVGNVDTGEMTVVEGAIVLRTPDGVEMTLSGQFETAIFNIASGTIDNIGLLDAGDIGARFASLSQVVPNVFSSVGDTAPDNLAEGNTNSDADVGPDTDNVDPQDEPSNDAQDSNASEPTQDGDASNNTSSDEGAALDGQQDGIETTQSAEPEPVLSTTNGFGADESGLSDASGLGTGDQAPTSDPLANGQVDGSQSAANSSDTGAGDAALTGGDTGDATQNENAATDLPPPPDVINDSATTDPTAGGGSGGAAGGGGTGGVNLAPSGTDNTFTFVTEAGTALPLTLLSAEGFQTDGFFTDPEGDTLTYSIVEITENGTPTATPAWITMTDPNIGLVSFNVPETYGLAVDTTVGVIVEADDGNGNTASAAFEFDLLAPDVLGTATNDPSLISTNANDLVLGLGGDDTISASGANAIIFGGVGADTITTGGFQSRVFAGDDNDLVTATGNESEIFGGLGDDTINIQSDDNSVFGQTGDDTFVIVAGAVNNTIDGGAGADSVDYSAYATALTLILDAGNPIVVTGSNDTLSGIENITGGLAADTITGDDVANIINGGLGADTLSGGGGNDNLDGGDGNDIFVALNNDGDDTLDGNTGVDTYDASGSNENRTYDLSVGTITSTPSGQLDTISNIENFTAGGGDDVFMTNDADANQTYDGGAGNDLYDASGATNTMTIDLGANQVNLGGDIDTVFNIEEFHLSSSASNVVMASGGNGDHIYDAGAGGNDDYNATGITDQITFTFFASETLAGFNGETDTLRGFESLQGGSNIDTLDFSNAGSLVDVDLQAMTINNDGFGGSFGVDGVENITGSDFNDVLHGDVGVNVLNGGMGDDVLIGNDGNDTLNGGLGYDVADYSGAGGGITADLTLSDVSNDGFAGNDTLINIEEVRGTTFIDTITGESGVLVLGGDGDDNLTYQVGSAGVDLSGENGADTFFVNGGATDITSDGTSILMRGGMDASSDTLQFNASGVFNINMDGSEDRIEEIEFYDFQSNAGADTINLTIQDFMIDNNQGQTLTIQINDNDVLDLDFLGANYMVTSGDGDLTTGDTFLELFDSGSGNTVRIDYTLNAGAIGSINLSGLSGGASDLNLNLLAVGLNSDRGFAIENVGAGAQRFGHSISGVGDIDNDGFDNFFITEGADDSGSGEIFKYDGAVTGFIDDSSNVAPFGGDVSDMLVTGIGDFNGDGIADYLVSAPQSNGTGEIAVFDGSSNTVLLDLSDLNGGDFTGQSIAGIGDVNADGYADIIIGAPGTDGSGANAGSVYVLYGNNYGGPHTIDIDDLGVGVIDVNGVGSVPSDQIFNNAGQIYVSYAGGIRSFNVDNDGFMGLTNTVDSGDLNAFSAGAITTGMNDIVAISSSTQAVTEVVAIDSSGVITVMDNNLNIQGALNNGALSGAKDVAINGARAYVLTNTGIQVIDISTPSTPVYIGSVGAGLPNNLENIDIRGNDLYVTANDAGSQLIRLDIGASQDDPPLDTSFDGDGSLNFGPNGANDMVLDLPNNRAFISVDLGGPGNGASRIYAVDLASGAIISQIDQIDIPGLGDVVSLTYLDNKLHVASTTNGGSAGTVWTFDVTNTVLGPNEPPRIVGRYEAGNLNDVSIVGIADNGPDSVPLAIRTTGQVITIDTDPEGVLIEGGGTSDFLGANVAAAGNVNDDAFADYLIAAPTETGGLNAGVVHLIFGDPRGQPSLGTDTFTITDIDVDGANSQIDMFYMGDVNGAGESDFAIVENYAGNTTLHFFYGENISGASTVSIDTSDFQITESGGDRLIAGGFAGDFNGDGFDDFVVGVDTDPANVSTAKTIDLYVVYGDGALPGTINTAGFNASNSYHMTYTLDAPFAGNFDFEITSVGDINGDGYDDIAIGTTSVDNDNGINSDAIGGNDDDDDGTVFFVYGEDNTGLNVSLNAAANNDNVIGSEASDTLNDNNNNNVTFRAGGGDDVINLQNMNFNDIDGGAGFDALNFLSGGTLDFRGINAEEITRIEEFDTSAATALMTLDVSDIFQILGTSDDRSFSIRANGSSTLTIDLEGVGVADADVDIDEFARIFRATHAGNDGTFEIFDVGGSELKIDALLFSNNNIDAIV